MEKGSTRLNFTQVSGYEAYSTVCGGCLLDDSCVQRLWLFSLTATRNPRTALICKTPKVRCTFLGSVVSLLTGVEKKVWLISHCRNRADRRPSWFLVFTTLRPLRASTVDREIFAVKIIRVLNFRHLTVPQCSTRYVYSIFVRLIFAA